MKEKTDLVPIITVAECFPPPQNNRKLQTKETEAKGRRLMAADRCSPAAGDWCSCELPGCVRLIWGYTGQEFAVQFSRQFRTDSKVMTDCIEKQKALEKAWGWHTLDWVYRVWGEEGGGARLQQAAAEMTFDSWDWWGDGGGRWGLAEKTTNSGQRNMHFLRRFHQTEALRNKTYIWLEQIHPLVQSQRSVVPSAVSRDWTTSTQAALVSTGEDAQSNSIVIYVEIQIKLEELSPPILTNSNWCLTSVT